MKKLALMVFLSLVFTGCAPIPTTPETRTQIEKDADRDFAASELIGDYEVVESRLDYYPGRKSGATKSIKVSASKGEMVVVFNSQKEGEWTILGSGCIGNNHKLSTNLFCTKASSGINYISFGKEKHGRQIKSGAVISAFPILNVQPGDYIFDFGELVNGRPHYYLLKKK